MEEVSIISALLGYPIDRTAREGCRAVLFGLRFFFTVRAVSDRRRGERAGRTFSQF